MDYQDYVSPVFRLDLLLARDDPSGDDEGRSMQGVAPKFSRSDDEILAGFAALVDRLVGSFDDFCRPEFCKIAELPASKSGAPGHGPASTKLEGTASARVDPYQGLSGDSYGQDAAAYSCGVQQDFEKLLYPGVDAGPSIYSKFIGRLEVSESDRATKGYRREYVRGASLLGPRGGAVKAPTYIDRFLRVADAGDACYRRAKQDILVVMAAHLKDTKRVLEIYQQFEPVM